MGIKVLLVSNWNDNCGISTYGNNLLLALEGNDEVSVTPFETGDSSDKLLKASEEVDVVHINWQVAISRPFYPEQWVEKCRRPVVLTNHYTEWQAPWYSHLSAVVIHNPETERLAYDLPQVRVRYIPHGVVKTDLSDKTVDGLVIGQGGLPGPHKKTEIVCRAAREIKGRGIDVSVYIVAPLSYRSNTVPLILQWKEILGDIKLTAPTEWMDEYTAIKMLHDNVSVCVHAGGNTGSKGISGSARMSISTHRPVVVNSGGELYSDLLDVEGIYPYRGDENLADTILEAYGNVGPEGFANKYSHGEMIKRYVELYKEVLGD